jgi:hypothetical protein
MTMPFFVKSFWTASCFDLLKNNFQLPCQSINPWKRVISIPTRVARPRWSRDTGTSALLPFIWYFHLKPSSILYGLRSRCVGRCSAHHKKGSLSALLQSETEFVTRYSMKQWHAQTETSAINSEECWIMPVYVRRALILIETFRIRKGRIVRLLPRVAGLL